MKKVFLALTLLGLSACMMPQPGMYGAKKSRRLSSGQAPSQSYVDEAITVETEPSGARIQVNDVFAGASPVKYTVRRFWRGQPGSMVLDTVKVEALPAVDGQCAQSGVFGEAARPLQVPVRFTMTNCSSVPASPQPDTKPRTK